MENRAKFGIIHIYRRSVAWEEAGLGIAEEVNSRRVAKFGETITAIQSSEIGSFTCHMFICQQIFFTVKIK